MRASPAGDRLISRLILGVLWAYKRFVSPVLPASCRFYPTCSEYAMGAIAKHGPLRGGILAARRLARCHPFNPGGFDPVPERLRPSP